MTYDWEEDGEADIKTTSSSPSFAGWIGNGFAYVLFALGLIGIYNFFAPFIGTGTFFALYRIVIPPVIAPTEAQTAVVDASHLIAGILLMAAAIYLR